MNSKEIYNKYKDILQIDFLINFVLLLEKKRRIIQIDTFQYDNDKINKILNFIKSFNYLIVYKFDTMDNIIIYLKEDSLNIEKLIIDNGGFRSNGFSKLLDDKFYLGIDDFSTIYNSKNITQVSINVIKNKNNVGEILVQMCKESTLSYNINKIYKTFQYYKKLIYQIDPTLQTSLLFYNKYNLWKDQDSLIIKEMEVV